MKVYLNEITGIAGAITSLYMSKRTWTREKEEEIRQVCRMVNNHRGQYVGDEAWYNEKYEEYVGKLLKYGRLHTTLLRFINLDVTVEGLHRAGQDDWDSHARRFDNRIVRSSTRLATFNYEMSDYYKGKIIPTDKALQDLGLPIPDSITVDGKRYVKTVNGYILEEFADDKDVKRGLYMLSIPSNFIFQVNFAELAHVYRMRNKNSGANPEVQELSESLIKQVCEFQPMVTREYILSVQTD